MAVLHFELIVNHLLESSNGNLFTINELSRLGEVSMSEQIRLAFNYEKISTVSREPHDLSQPLTGALFDIFVEVFQKTLVKKSLITQQLADQSMGPEGGMPDTDAINAAFVKAYKGKAIEFKAALLEARDYLGELLADIWQHLEPDYFSYTKVAAAALVADQRLTDGMFAETIRSCLSWREITFPPGHVALERFRVSDCSSCPAPSVSVLRVPKKTKRARR